MDLDKIIEDVKTHMSEKRYIHSLGVMKRIEELAKIYDVDIEIAKKVGIAHDVAKEMSVEQSFKYAEENNIEFDEIEREIPYLLHGKIGADMAKKMYGFDEKMQNAIIYHTTGNPDMDMLAKILYAADKTEENRNFKEYDVEYERELANKDIDEALIFMLGETIKNNIKSKKIIHPNSVITRNKLLIKIQKSL